MKTPLKKPINTAKMGVHERVMFLERQVANLEMALKISQNVTQQLLQQFLPMRNELQSNVGIVNDFQYRVIAMQKLLNVDSKELTKASDELKLKDWQESSDSADAKDSMKSKEEVSSKTDTVIITSTTPDESEDKGIFRSRVRLEELNPDFQNGLLNKRVGDKVELTLNNTRHVVELLGVRYKEESSGEQV
jgi:hypothetical protein